MLLVALFALSCQEDISNVDELLAQSISNQVSTDIPTITGVYEYSDFMASETPSPCVEAQMGDYLVISGENLEGVIELSIKGLLIDEAEYYAQYDKVVFQVPYVLPDEEIADKVICTTKFGSAEKSVSLAIPDIEITSVSNEFQLPGKSVSIYGSYLTLCEFKTNEESNIYIYKEADGVTEEYKKAVVVSIVVDDEILAVIPDDAPNNSYFVFEINGEEQPIRFHYRPTDLLMSDDTLVVNANYTSQGTYNTTLESDVPDIFGSDEVKYLRYKGNLSTGVMCAFYETYDGTEEWISDYSNYNFVYELNTLSGSTIASGTTYKLMVNDTGFNMWENYSKSEVDTSGEWVTQRISVSDFFYKVYTTSESSNKFNIKALAAIADADHAFANFRIEPIIDTSVADDGGIE